MNFPHPIWIHIHYTHNTYICFNQINSGIFLAFWMENEEKLNPHFEHLQKYSNTISILSIQCSNGEQPVFEITVCVYGGDCICMLLFSLFHLFIHSFLPLSCGFAYVFWKWRTKWKHTEKKKARQAKQNIQKKAKTTRKKK